MTRNTFATRAVTFHVVILKAYIKNTDIFTPPIIVPHREGTLMETRMEFRQDALTKSVGILELLLRSPLTKKYFF